MVIDSQETSSYTLPKAEIEKMLLNAHGDKLQPVNDEKMARQRQAIARYEEKREKEQVYKDGEVFQSSEMDEDDDGDGEDIEQILDRPNKPDN